MHENDENHEINEMSPYKRFYNDMYYARDASGRLTALQNLYEATTGMEYSESTARRIDFMYDQDDTENWRLATERLLLFPIVELGPTMELHASPDEIYHNHMYALSFIKTLTEGDHDSKCAAEHSNGETGCLASEQCPWLIAAMYCTEDALQANFDDLEYQLDYKRRYDVVTSRLKALRSAELFDTVYIEKITAHYQYDYENHFGSTSHTTTAEDQR